MRVERMALKNLVLVRLNPGDDLLAGLREATEKNEIRNAIILSGVGSVVSHHFHVVASSVNPPMESYIAGEAPADIVNLNGYVINGRVHAHITYTDKDIAYGGHLELGSRILTFSAIAMAEVDGDFDKWDSIGKIEDLRK